MVPAKLGIVILPVQSRCLATDQAPHACRQREYSDGLDSVHLDDDSMGLVNPKHNTDCSRRVAVLDSLFGNQKN
jgi:hypothetical protein